MAIHRLMQEASFEPDEVARMTAAYDVAMRELEVIDGADPRAELVAKKIIEISRAGERDPVLICVQALKELRIRL